MLGVADIISPIFLQYGQFNTGKTTLLSYLSALHGVRNGKVQSNSSTCLQYHSIDCLISDMTVSKLKSVLSASSCVFVPVDDPSKDLLTEISEVSSHTILCLSHSTNKLGLSWAKPSSAQTGTWFYLN